MWMVRVRWVLWLAHDVEDQRNDGLVIEIENANGTLNRERLSGIVSVKENEMVSMNWSEIGNTEISVLSENSEVG